MRVRNLKQLAKLVNDLNAGYTARTERSFSRTDYKPPGYRYITRPGKGRRGLRLTVRNDRTHETVIDHDTSETYRTVEEAILKCISLFGDALNVDPDEVLKVGDEVYASEFVRFDGVIAKVKMRKGSKTRVESYGVRFHNGYVATFPSRRVTKVRDAN